MQFFLLYFCLLFNGCRHRIQLESYPPGAKISMKNEELGVTPFEYTIWWWPYRSIPLQADLRGYEQFEIQAGKTMRLRSIGFELLGFRYLHLLGLRPRRSHTFVMIREHAEIGNWTPEDAKKQR